MGLAPAQDLAPRLAGVPLSDIEIPKGREEDWRFTPLARLKGLTALTANPGAAGFAVNAPAGVEVSEGTANFVFPTADRLAAAAVELSSTVLKVNIPKESVPGEPITLTLRAAADLGIARIEIHAEAYSKSTVLIDHVGAGTTAVAVHFVVDNSASLTVLTVQDGDRSQVIAGQHAFTLGPDATAEHFAITLGGDLVRLVTTAEFTAPGAKVEFAGAFFTTDGQHHEHRLFVDHAVPNCTSYVVYKGALQDEGTHSVWIGDVLIRKAATGTSTYELNRNLLLSDGARADSVPNLEIETGEIVGAGHAAATGRFDDEQIFYLTSRGIPETVAKRLVVAGFLNEVVNRIPLAEVRDRLLNSIETRLGEVDPLFAELSND
jgi:Fe-S cluster assembly protein SufD